MGMAELQVQAVYAKLVNLLEVLSNDLICLAYANETRTNDAKSLCRIIQSFHRFGWQNRLQHI